MDLNNNGFLEASEFINGMVTLFCGDFDSSSLFIFHFYDFDKDGQISKEDIRTVLSYISLSNEIKHYKDRVRSQEELFDIIEKCYLYIKNEKMNYASFKKVIENCNSDIYLMILLFLYEKKPFTKASLNNYSKKNKKSPTNSPGKSPTSPSKKIASPTKNMSFSPYNFFQRPNKRKQTITQGLSNLNQQLLNNSVRRSTAKRYTIQGMDENDIIKLMPVISHNNQQTTTQENLRKSTKPKAVPIPTDGSSSPQRVNRKANKNLKELGGEIKSNLRNTGKFNDVKITPAFKQTKNKGVDGGDESEESNISGGKYENEKKDGDDLIFGSDEEDSGDEEENVVTNEGFLYKLVDNKLKKVFFRLVHKDLFFFKNDKDENHKGMHNLSGVFIQEEKPKDINGKKYYCFSMVYPKKTRFYYVEKSSDYKVWIEKLKIATGYTNLTDLYEIKEKIGNGKFGLIKLGINKVNKEKVAIKIMSKKDMTTEDLELVRTEIEILKICQHPNIIRLYEVFENTEYFYIIMEYCSGGDLFSYLEKRGFRLAEPHACRIMHKMCAAVYYIHSYGIAHRDLKPENVLMTSTDDEADIRILDFGLSKIIGPDEKCTEPYGTLSYVAPEVLLDQPYGKEVDLWSLGVITYLMLSGSLPFDHKTDEEEIARKTIAEPPPYKGQIWEKISKEARNFVDRLLQKKPEKRMTIKEALEHEWFHKFGGAKMADARKKSKDLRASNFLVYSTVDEKDLAP